MATLNVKNFPDALYKKLNARAKSEGRSVAQEVAVLLEAALAEPEKLSILDLRELGKEIWQGIDAAEYVARERDSWES